MALDEVMRWITNTPNPQEPTELLHLNPSGLSSVHDKFPQNHHSQQSSQNTVCTHALSEHSLQLLSENLFPVDKKQD